MKDVYTCVHVRVTNVEDLSAEVDILTKDPLILHELHRNCVTNDRSYSTQRTTSQVKMNAVR